MKIKADFVTNSSSTSYTLRSVVTGHIEPLGNLKKLEELSKKLDSKFNFIYDDYAHFQYSEGHQKMIEYFEHEYHTVNVSLMNKSIWENINAANIVNKISVLHITIDNHHDWDHNTLELTKNVVETVLAFFNLKSNSNLNYVAFPTAISGDGWDGGDTSCGPQSQYGWTKDVYENESRMGVLTIVDGTINPYVIPLIENKSFMEETVRFMNSQGVCLNDTDS